MDACGGLQKLPPESLEIVRVGWEAAYKFIMRCISLEPTSYDPTGKSLPSSPSAHALVNGLDANLFRSVLFINAAMNAFRQTTV